MRRPLIVLAVGGLAAVLLLVGGMALWYERPTVLTVAVSSADEQDHDLITAAATQLKHGREPVRLRLIPVENANAASAAIDDGKADLAVVRSDIAMPDKGQTVVILHRDAAILLAPGSGDINEIADLKGHRLGIVHNGAGNTRLLETALAQYDIAADALTVVPLQPEEVAEAIRSKRIDAVMAVDVVSGPLMRDLVKAVVSGGQGAPVFIPVAEAAAIAQRSPAYDSTEIVKGAFGGSPPRPAEEFDTLSVTHRLVANEMIGQGPIADLTRFLLTERSALAAASPLARRIEAPSTDKDVGASGPCRRRRLYRRLGGDLLRQVQRHDLHGRHGAWRARVGRDRHAEPAQQPEGGRGRRLGRAADRDAGSRAFGTHDRCASTLCRAKPMASWLRLSPAPRAATRRASPCSDWSSTRSGPPSATGAEAWPEAPFWPPTTASIRSASAAAE